ncbi:TPA: hypothetical protein ACWC4P_004070 [Salmonella enterica]
MNRWLSEQKSKRFSLLFPVLEGLLVAALTPPARAAMQWKIPASTPTGKIWHLAVDMALPRQLQTLITTKINLMSVSRTGAKLLLHCREGGMSMKIGEHMEPVIELLEELNGNDTDAKLKLLALVISEYMINADVTGFEVSAGRMKVAVDISVED